MSTGELCSRARGQGQPHSPPQQALQGWRVGEGSAHPGATMATPEPTLSLGSNSVRIIIYGMHSNFLQMKCMELPAKWSQPPPESTETEQTLLRQEQRSGFSVPTEMLSCPSSPRLVPLPGMLPGSHGHCKVLGGLWSLSFICQQVPLGCSGGPFRQPRRPGQEHRSVKMRVSFSVRQGKCECKDLRDF